MNKKNVSKAALSLALSAALTLPLAGCSDKDGAQSSSAAQSAQSKETNVVTYRVATEGAYAPFNYVDEDGKPDGYDIAVAKAVDELIPEVQFEYQAVEWSSIFAGLEAEKYDLIVSQAAKTPGREEKYLFGDTAYTWGIGAIAYKSGRTDIKSMDDLAGKTVTVGVGSSNANVIETWNAEHGNVINVTYGDGDISKALLDVQEGRVDATLVSPVTAGLVVKEQGLDVEFALRNDDTVKPVYWLFNQNEDGEYLKPLVDKALQTLLDNGTLAELSKTYLGDDYSTQEAVQARIR